MDLSELANKPIEEMTEEELKELERIGNREYYREWSRKNRDKQRETFRRSRAKKGQQALKEVFNGQKEVPTPTATPAKNETPKLKVKSPERQAFSEELAALEWRIKKLDQPKKRHTFKTSLETLDALDEFCKEHLVEKGFVLQIALEEFMSKYK